MRLVLVSDHATVSGGASAVALASADGLRARGHEVTVWTPKEPQSAKTNLWNQADALRLSRLLDRDTLVHVHSWAQFSSSSIFSAIRQTEARLIVENCTFTGWNIGPYCDGGASVKRLKTENLVEANTATPGWPVTFTDLDTTPSLAMGNDFIASNTGATSITQFDNMQRGESYRIRFTNSNTTLVDGANLICPGSANLTPGDTDIYTVYTPNGTTAYISAGSNN